MAFKSTICKIGEDHAKENLIQLGYTILAQNWRYKHLEVDIVAKQNNSLVIVEVKTRKNDYFGQPFENVNFQKQLSLGRAALAYMSQTNYFGEVRFDIISIVLNDFNIPKETKHIEDAFWFQ